MKIGVSIQIFWNYERLDLSSTIPHAINDLKFECVEITCQNPMFEGWGAKIQEGKNL